MSRRREPYNFDNETKIKALKETNFRCGKCGKSKQETPEGYLEIHHILPVSIALDYFPQAIHVLNKVENALPLCIACHKEVHNNLTLEVCESIVAALLGIARQSD